jgi:hypothetical protein
MSAHVQTPAVDITAGDLAQGIIRNAASVTANNPANVSHDIIRNAQRTCSCAKCGCTLPPDAPVGREGFPVKPRFGGRVWYMRVPVCERCISKPSVSQNQKPCPCEHCQRPIRIGEHGWSRGWRLFCCEKCESAVRVKEARERRATRHGPRPCQTCGETFEPTRAAARYCSSPCRQRAYRRRTGITEDETFGIPYFSNCNASAEVVS